MANGEFSWDEVERGDAFAIRGPRERITLARTSGRWAHRIELGSGVSGETSPLITTVEVDPEQADPERVVSPVYQELHRHEFAGDECRGVCVLLTGHQFQHHFSAALSVFRDPDDPQSVVLDVDLADRCRAPVASLAASYALRLDGGSLIDAGESAITWRVPDLGPGFDRLELRCDAPGTLALSERGRAATRVQILAGLHPTFFTHRLRYRWRWSAGPAPA